jgi:negative regulator of flagellin synthesis FlgM
MKIGPLDNKSTVAPTNGQRKAQAGSPATDAKAEPSTHVELSAAANLLARAQADGSFDAGKVERLAAEIRDGRFQVDADAIADKLIAHAREMLQGGSSQ